MTSDFPSTTWKIFGHQPQHLHPQSSGTPGYDAVLRQIRWTGQHRLRFRPIDRRQRKTSGYDRWRAKHRASHCEHQSTQHHPADIQHRASRLTGSSDNSMYLRTTPPFADRHSEYAVSCPKYRTIEQKLGRFHCAIGRHPSIADPRRPRRPPRLPRSRWRRRALPRTLSWATSRGTTRPLATI